MNLGLAVPRRVRQGRGLQTSYLHSVRHRWGAPFVRSGAIPGLEGLGEALPVVHPFVRGHEVSSGVAWGALIVAGNFLWGDKNRPTRENDDVREVESAERVVGVGRAPLPTVCDARGVWVEAWRPLRSADGIHGVTWLESIDGRGRGSRRTDTWVGAIDPARVRGLVWMCLEEVERALSDGEHACDIDEMLVVMSRNVAMRWLGYVPDVLAMTGEGVETREPQEGLLGAASGAPRCILYERVVRLLRVGGEDEGAGGVEAGEDLPAVPVSWAPRIQSWGEVDGGDGGDRGDRGDHAGGEKRRQKFNGGSDASTTLYRVAPAILHDMAMQVADRVCGAYVQDVLAGNPSKSSLWPAFLDPQLVSTRDVQGFVNRLYLKRLVDEYVQDIVDIYEDTLPLTRFVERDNSLVVCRNVVRTRRGHELAALRGAKYCVSLLLEGFDVVRPMVDVCQRWVAGFVAWALREVVGRGIGFVWEGMKKVREGSDGGEGIPKGDSRGETAGLQIARQRDDLGDAWPDAGVFV